MKLNFLGTGNAFNPNMGNTAAYFIDKDELFLIDCGESVYHAIMNTGLLTDAKDIHLMITHTHSDHVGSLGTLVLYVYWVLGKTLKIILPINTAYIKDIKTLLSIFGCLPKMYEIKIPKDYDAKYEKFETIRYVRTDHCPELSRTFGLIFESKDDLTYYSGDTCSIKTLKMLLNDKKPLTVAYIDVGLNSPVHLSLTDLIELIPKKDKEKIYCMHTKDKEFDKLLLDCGFQLASSLIS